MKDVTKEIERPLGQSAETRRAKGGLLPSPRSLVATMAILCIVAVSSAIALRERSFRDPSQSPVTPTESVEVASPAPSSGPGASGTAMSGGTSIIHVDPARAAEGSGVIIIRDPSDVSQNLAFAHLPDRTLIEDTDAGPLPIRSSDGRRPFDVYARPWSGSRGAKVAIVIGGLAVSQTGTQAAIEKLPAEVTLAFASQGNSIGRWMQAARRKGHEILMQAPLEPFDYPRVDPGLNTLTVEASEQENIERLQWTLARTTNYTGIMNYMGARFVTDTAAMAPLMGELSRRGLLYLDDGTVARSVAPELARNERVPFAAADAIIDSEHDRGAILRKLDQLEATARAQGFAIGTGSAFDLTVDTVTSWVAEARKRGVEIVPVSALATDPERG